MENAAFLEYIESIQSTLLSSENKITYEIVFLKIFVKYEQFLLERFKFYSVGQTSESGYTPNRKLNFSDEAHLNIFLRKNNSYLECFDVIDKYSNHIFVENPFFCIFEVADNQTHIKNMITLRNYIVHESPESQKKYIDITGKKTFIEPHKFLLSTKKGSATTMFQLYVNVMINTSNFICSPVF